MKLRIIKLKTLFGSTLFTSLSFRLLKYERLLQSQEFYWNLGLGLGKGKVTNANSLAYFVVLIFRLSVKNFDLYLSINEKINFQNRLIHFLISFCEAFSVSK